MLHADIPKTGSAVADQRMWAFDLEIRLGYNGWRRQRRSARFRDTYSHNWHGRVRTVSGRSILGSHLGTAPFKFLFGHHRRLSRTRPLARCF